MAWIVAKNGANQGTEEVQYCTVQYIMRVRAEYSTVLVNGGEAKPRQIVQHSATKTWAEGRRHTLQLGLSLYLLEYWYCMYTETESDRKNN